MAFIRKILVLLPVLLLGAFFYFDHHYHFQSVNGKRLVFLLVTVGLLYGWFIIEAAVRKQTSLLDIAVQSSYFVYFFMVLALTGYFHIFREVSGTDWWNQILNRIERGDHVNTEPGTIFRIYELKHRQIVGNLLLLFPLPVYIQLLYPPFSRFFVCFVICVLVALMIEGLQLAVRRSADVDDILLNVSGALAGLILFRGLRWLLRKTSVKKSYPYGRPLA